MEIKEAIYGLNDAIIKLNEVFTPEKCIMIIDGIKKGLDVDSVLYYSNPEFTTSQMNTIYELMRKCKDCPDILKRIRTYDLVKYDFLEIKEIIYGIAHDLTDEQISMYYKAEHGARHMREIRLGLEHGLPEERIKLLCNNSFSGSQLEQIRLGLEHGLSDEQIKLYLYKDPEYYSYAQMEQIRLGLEHGLSDEQLELFTNNEFNYEQMYQIRRGLEKGLSVEQVKKYALVEYSPTRMNIIRYRTASRIEHLKSR